MTPTKAKTKFELYKTNVGLFLRNPWSSSYNNYAGTPYMQNYRINGVVQDKAPIFNGYIKLDIQEDEILSVDKLKQGGLVCVGYKLKHEYLASDKIPLFLKPETVNAKWDDDEERMVWESLDTLQSLYEVVQERSSDSWEKEDFEVVVLGTLYVENFQQPERMVVKTMRPDDWGVASDKMSGADVASIVRYEDFERMLTPDFLLHERPCFLTSKQVYDIVRAYVKENINPKNACITSDYDFCFTVKRKVKIKPYEQKREVLNSRGKSFARPKFKSSTVQHKEVEIFEMTWAGYKGAGGYQGYTCIEGWKANNLKEMQEQIKQYLEELMEHINEDVQECPHCSGVGHVVNKLGTNER